MESIASSQTMSRASAHAMGFSSYTPGTSIWSVTSHCDNDGFLSSSLRAGGPRLTSLPAYDQPIDHPYLHTTGLVDIHDMLAFEDAVRRILRDHGINQQTDVRISGRSSIVRREPAPISTVLVVFTDALPIDSSEWRNAAKAIHSRFNTRLPETSVELIHQNLLRRPRCHPILPSHPIVPVWERTYRLILQHSDTRGWSGVSCWRYGTEDVPNDNPLTLIVSLLESAQGPFITAIQQIKAILAMNSVENVDILFMKDEAVPHHGGFDRDRLEKDTCSQYVQPGVSIGIHASDADSSTLGGLVELKFRDIPEWRPFALTCFHSVWPPAAHRSNLPGIVRGAAARDALDSWEFEPVLRNNNRAKQLLQVDQPSQSDLRATIKHVQARIGDQKDDEFRRLEKIEQAGEYMIPRDERRYKRRKEVIQSFEHEQEFFETFLNGGVRLGHVYAGSGVNRVYTHRNQEKQLFDWALILVLGERLPASEAPFPYAGRPKFNFAGVSSEPLLKGTRVMKSGRSTGFTEGRLNSIKSVRLAHIRNPRGPGSTIHETFEYQVAGFDQVAFSVPGDSGSFVTDMTGNVIGMLLGGFERSGISYITPIVDIFNDIKIVTKAEDVRLVE